MQTPGTHSCEEKKVALVGLHFVHKTKSRPQWIWTTFEHIDNVPDPDQDPTPGKTYTFNNGDPSVPAFPFTGVPTRVLTLNEDFDEFGRLIQTMGTTHQNGLNNQGMPTWGQPYLAPCTENTKAGSVEVWEIMNLTGDTHPSISTS